MDYEPVRLPSKKGRSTQTKAETKTHDPFGSNVKLVGDNITEKDYYDFLEGFSDPYGEKREQDQKEQLAKIRTSADNRIRSSQSTSTSQADAFVKGFNKEKTTGILNPHLPYNTDRAFGFLGTEDSELKPTAQRLNASLSITNAINRNPNKEYDLTRFSGERKHNIKEKIIDDVKDFFIPPIFNSKDHKKMWALGADAYLTMKGYHSSAWLLKHSLEDNPKDVYRDNNSRIAALIKNDPAFLTELNKAIAESNGKTLETTVPVKFESGDLYYSIHKSNIKIRGYKGNDGKWKISARLADKYDFTELTSWMNGKDATLGTLANDAAVFSSKLGAITPYNIYVDFNIER